MLKMLKFGGSTPSAKGSRLLCHRRRWQSEVLRAREDITRLMVLECGKPLAEARAEFDKG